MSSVDHPCPNCGSRPLTIERRLKAKPFGEFALAGVQVKATASETYWLTCGSCDFAEEGKR